MKTQLAQHYRLNNYGNYYTISNKDDRDVYYFNKSLINLGFPFQTNIKTDVFDDELLSYCEKKMNQDYLPNEKFEFFLITYFNRLLKHENKLNLYKIENYLLNKNGTLNTVLLNYDIDKCIIFADNFDIYFKINTPYSNNYNWWLFKTTLKMFSYNYFEIDNDIAQLSRDEFEKELNSDNLKFEYIEYYDPKNKFYFEFVKESDNLPQAKIVLYMTTEEQVNMFFLKNEYF